MQPPTSRDDELSGPNAINSQPRKRPRISYPEADDASEQVHQSIKSIEGVIIQWCIAKGLPLDGVTSPSERDSLAGTSTSRILQPTIVQSFVNKPATSVSSVASSSRSTVPLRADNSRPGSTIEEPIYVGSSDDESPSDFVQDGRILGPSCESGDVVVVYDLHPTVSYDDFMKMLASSGISSSMIGEATKYQCGSISLRFSRERDADAAFAQLHSMCTPFPWKGSVGWGRVQRWPVKEQTRPIPAVARRVLLDATQGHGQSTPSLYGNLNTGVYDERDEVQSSPPRPQPIVIPRMPVDRQPAPVLVDSWEDQTSSDVEMYDDDADSDDSRSSEDSVNVMGRAYNLSSQPVFPKATAPHQGRAPRRISTGSSRIVRSPDNQPSRSNTGIPRVPNTPYNRARRVLVPSSRTLPLITLSMRADAQFFDRQQRHRISSYSLPFKGDYCHVEDACIIGDTAIVGYSGGPCQISLIRLIKDQRPTMTELRHMPHSRPANHKPERKGVVHISCLGPGPSEDRLRIYTGGYDKTVRLWSLNEHDATSKKIIGTAAVPLAVAHRNQTVLVSEGQQLLTVDLKHSISKPQTARLSNTIHHIHINPDAENVSILELGHLDFQMQVFDNRKPGGHGRAPDCQFGYRHGGQLQGQVTLHHTRGSTHLSYFARGYPDGCVCLWDYRNTQQPVIKMKRQRDDPVVHATFDGSHVVCFGKESVTFFNYQEPDS